jgi:NSS family neurotransmitter:Na+ symporter
MDLEDFFVSNLILPLGGLAFALYCCHRFGWGWKGFVVEANAGAGPKVPFAREGRRGFAAEAVRIYCAYVLPAITCSAMYDPHVAANTASGKTAVTR